MKPFELYPSQEEHAERLRGSLTSFGCALDTSDTGTGKTPVAVDVAWQLGRRPVIACPKTVVPSWERWLAQREWNQEPVVLNYERYRMGKTPYYSKGCDSYGTAIGWDLDPEQDLLIFDEVQRCKGLKTETSQLLRYSAGIPTLALSATAASSPLDMKALGGRFGLFPSHAHHWNWCRKHGCRPGAFGGMRFTNGEKWVKKIRAELAPMMSRLRREDIPEFPDSLIIDEGIDFGSQLTRLWKELEAKIESIPTAQERIVEILRARQKAELLKVPHTVELALDALEEGNSVAIFQNFHASIDMLMSGLRSAGIEPREYSGRTAKDRDGYAQDFCADRLDSIIVQNASGGVGLNLHGQRHRTALHSPTWSADQHKQCLGRVWRAGGAKSVQRILTCGDDEKRVQEKAVINCGYIDLFNG